MPFPDIPGGWPAEEVIQGHYNGRTWLMFRSGHLPTNENYNVG